MLVDIRVSHSVEAWPVNEKTLEETYLMRTKLAMNTGWLYCFGEPEYLRTRAESSDQTYRGSRAANARGPARRDFDDSGWERVSLPHDFVAFRGISETDAHGGEHFDFPMDRGSAWYRRYFCLDEADRSRRIVLHFEGMGTFCEVYVNSMLLKTNRTNGIGFDVDITDVARFGFEQNVVAVHCDCHDYEAWYYEGGGITRNVWLVKTDRLSVALWGTFVRTARQGDDWRADIETELINVDSAPRRGRVVSIITDAAGKEFARAVSDEVCVAPRETGFARQTVTVSGVQPWSPKTPALYTLTTLVEGETGLLDDYTTVFGFRELKFDSERGLFVNGEKTTIYGFANHMTYLGVGEAMTDSMCEYQIRTLRDMGSNGYRTAHSPHQEAIMDWCDRYGQLVMDENRIFHSSDIVIDEVRRLVKRDRNHPSVCMWSVYNEEDFVTNETGRRIFSTLKREILRLDPTRPVTGATSYGMFIADAQDDYDIFGFNHQTMHFDALHHQKPNKPIYCSEMIMPVGKLRNFGGDISVRAGEDALQLQKDYVIGGFHFTAWNYGPGRPEIIGMEGTLAAGYYGFKAYLRRDEPLVKICPGWDFPGCEGGQVELNIANNGDCVELYVNGKLACSAQTDMYSITPVSVTYEPGEIRAVAYRGGEVWAEDTARTPGAPARVRLVYENQRLPADGSDAAIVSAYIVDERGTLCAHETGRLLRFSCDENGELLTTLSLRDDLYQRRCGPEIRTFDGKCQALFRSRATDGPLHVRVEAQGLPAADIEIARTPAAFAQVLAVDCAFVNGWRISKAFTGAMDDMQLMRGHMTERWLPVDTLGTPVVERRRAGFGQRAVEQGSSLSYAYYTKTTVPDLGEKDGRLLALRFEGIDGKANIYVTDGARTDVGRHAGDSPWFGHYRPELIVPCDSFKPGDEVEIWVMMHEVGRVHGIGWPVHWLYTTREEIAALDRRTEAEWAAHSET